MKIKLHLPQLQTKNILLDRTLKLLPSVCQARDYELLTRHLMLVSGLSRFFLIAQLPPKKCFSFQKLSKRNLV